MQFNLNSSAPSVILAERPFGGHHPVTDSWPIGVAGMLNLPAVLAAMLTQSVLESALGLLGASWVGTAVFFVVGCVQWWIVGWLVNVVRHRRQPATA
jgi:hypothetical protein